MLNEVLPYAMFAYNTAVPETTAVIPFHLVHERKAMTMLDSMLHHELIDDISFALSGERGACSQRGKALWRTRAQGDEFCQNIIYASSWVREVETFLWNRTWRKFLKPSNVMCSN